MRVLTLLDHVLNYQKAIGADKEIYFGNQMWDSGDVIRDKKNPWYMYDMYPHKKFPYYMSGSGYGMSKKLAKCASIQAAKEPNLGWKMQALEFAYQVSRQKEVNFWLLGQSRLWGKMTCKNTKDILDNPAFNVDFNMYTSFYNDLDGKFVKEREAKFGKPFVTCYVKNGNLQLSSIRCPLFNLMIMARRLRIEEEGSDQHLQRHGCGKIIQRY